MKLLTSSAVITFVVACAALTSGCADMDRRERGTAVGATVGGVAGAVLTDGSPAGAVAGAVIGGVVGSEENKRK